MFRWVIFIRLILLCAFAALVPRIILSEGWLWKVVNIFVFDENKARLQLASNNNIRFFTSEGFSIQIKCSDTFRWLSPTVGVISFVFPKTMRFWYEAYQGYKSRNDNLWALVRGWPKPCSVRRVSNEQSGTNSRLQRCVMSLRVSLHSVCWCKLKKRDKKTYRQHNHQYLPWCLMVHATPRHRLPLENFSPKTRDSVPGPRLGFR